MPDVAIVMGSDSDLSIMKEAADVLAQFEVDYEVTILSAHRLPRETAVFAEATEARGIKAIIAGAGGAAHLAGVIAAFTVIPVIGVPIQTGSLSGVDSLYSMVQMPKGVPVATVAINGAANAGLLALHMLGISNETIRQKLKEYRSRMADEVKNKDRRLQEIGIEDYLKNK